MFVRTVVVSIVLAIAATQAVAAGGYVRVLLPVYIAQPTAGAYGSLWVSQFALRNASADRQYTIETICAPDEGCAGDVTTDENVAPQQTKVSLPSRYRLPKNPVAGATVWLLTTDAVPNDDDLAYNLRVVDLSRSATAAGTEIPVVREREFRDGTVHLLNVPADPRFRLALRVFEMNLAHADFAVRIIDATTNAVLAVVPMTTSTDGAEPRGFTPGFAELNQFVGGGQLTPVRVEIAPLTPGVAFWAYVSITNNDSQQITLVTPQ